MGVFLGVLATLALATALWIRSVADRRWVAMKAETRELLAEARSRDSSRPALRGVAIEGNAWDDYSVAMNFKLGTGPLSEYVSRGPKADRSAVEAILAAHPTALDSLRRGARRTHGQYPVDLGQGMKAIPALSGVHNLASLAACQSRFLAEAGRAREAAELLLDTCQFARDVGNNSLLICEMIGIGIYGIAFEELRDLILSGKLTPEELSQIGRELELLDRSFPRTGISMVNESAFVGLSALGSEEGSTELEVDTSEIATSWRFGFSTRLMRGDAFDTLRKALGRLREIDEKPWSETKMLLEKVTAELEASRNPITRSVGHLPSSVRAGRRDRARLRLLRVAAHYLATGEVLELDDPFGVKLLTLKAGEILKVWSVGKDGKDDGGTGDFKRADQPDIVLEVER